MSKNPKHPQPLVFWDPKALTVWGLCLRAWQHPNRQGWWPVISSLRTQDHDPRPLACLPEASLSKESAIVCLLPSLGETRVDFSLSPYFSLDAVFSLRCFHSLWGKLQVSEVTIKKELPGPCGNSSESSPQCVKMCGGWWHRRQECRPSRFQRDGEGKFKSGDGQGRTLPIIW